MTVEQLKNYLNRVTNTQKEVMINGITLEEDNIDNNNNHLNIEIEEKRYKRLINLLKF